MATVRIMTDSACDIPDEALRRLNIEMLSIPITIDGKGYRERESFSVTEFYDILAKTSEIPKTSAIPAAEYYERYKKAYEDGITEIINVTINAGGSSIFATASMARERFFDERPETAGRIRIHIIDSKSYCLGYGGPVMQAAKMALESRPCDEILKFLNDCFCRTEIYLGVYSLDFAKRSGRIGAATAFVGDVLGVRPVISMTDGFTKIVERVRGEKNLAPKIFSIYKENLKSHDLKPLIVCGSEPEWGEQLASLLKKELGETPPVYRAGAAITINAGPRMIALVAKGKRR